MTEKTQAVINAEIQRDIKYIRRTLDDLVTSLNSYKTRVSAVETLSYETKLRVDNLEHKHDEDMASLMKGWDEKWSDVKKIGYMILGLIITVVGGALLNLIIK